MIRDTDPGSEFVLIAFNGELIGCVKEASPEEGYLIQVQYDLDIFPPTVLGEKRLEGRVDILGNTETEDREVIQARLNHIRAELGMEPLE